MSDHRITDDEVERFLRSQATIEKGISLAIQWEQVLALRSVAESLERISESALRMAFPIRQVTLEPNVQSLGEYEKDEE